MLYLSFYSSKKEQEVVLLAIAIEAPVPEPGPGPEVQVVTKLQASNPSTVRSCTHET